MIESMTLLMQNYSSLVVIKVFVVLWITPQRENLSSIHSFISLFSFQCWIAEIVSNPTPISQPITFPFISILSHSLFIIIITYYIHNKWLIHIIEWIKILSNEYYFFYSPFFCSFFHPFMIQTISMLCNLCTSNSYSFNRLWPITQIIPVLFYSHIAYNLS